MRDTPGAAWKHPLFAGENVPFGPKGGFDREFPTEGFDVPTKGFNLRSVDVAALNSLYAILTDMQLLGERRLSNGVSAANLLESR